LRAQDEFKEKIRAGSDARAVTQQELDKQLDDMKARDNVGQDVKIKLEELAEFRAKAAYEAAQKKLGSQQALSVLQRSLAKGEDGVKMSSFAGWASLTKEEKQKRLTKDKAMKRALKTIAGEGMAWCNEVFDEWAKEMERVKAAAMKDAKRRLEEASKNSGAGSMEGRQRAIKQLEKQFKGEDFALMQTCFQGWALGQIARKKREQNHKKATRLIGNSSKALLAEVVGLWNGLTEKTRKKNRDKAANMKAAGRVIANSDKALTTQVFLTLVEWIEGIRRKRKGKEEGTAKAMRMMANSDAALLNVCFDSWMKLHFELKKKDQGNKKALRMMSDSAQGLVIGVFKEWSAITGTKKSKEAGTAKAVRMINASAEALSASVYQSWANWVRKHRDKNKKIRALEKSFGAQDTGVKLVVMTSWHGYAKVTARAKKAKNLSMKTAIKSITGNQELLLCHLLLAWARYASFDRTEKVAEAIKNKGGEFDAAVEKARGAFEGELVEAQSKVDAAAADLEAMKKQREDAKANITSTEGRLEEQSWALQDFDRQVALLEHELVASRRRAEDIGKELGKVGIFLTNVHKTRGGKVSRPSSGTGGAVDTSLPRISGSNSRPRSGASGSKTARGVAGERGGSPRGGSGRSDGRPPRSPQEGMERRYLLDGSGPYLFGEVQEMYRDNAMAQWTAGAPESSSSAPDARYA
jgi:hypothetical protein